MTNFKPKPQCSHHLHARQPITQIRQAARAAGAGSIPNPNPVSKPLSACPSSPSKPFMQISKRRELLVRLLSLTVPM